MTTAITFDALRRILTQRMRQLPDYRKGSNTQYSIEEAAWGAFGIYFMQSPSFLDSQRHLQHTKGHHNACTLFGVEQIPCDHQIRNLLDRDPSLVGILEHLRGFVLTRVFDERVPHAQALRLEKGISSADGPFG